MENFVKEIGKMAMSAPAADYLQLRFFLDTISQSEVFLTNIVAPGFGRLHNGEAIEPQRDKPIVVERVFTLLSNSDGRAVRNVMDSIIEHGTKPTRHTLSTLKKYYSALNSLRNALFFSLKNSASPDQSLDGRMDFLFGDNMYYDIFVDGQMYLPKISESLVLNRILRETTIAGKIKGARRHYKECLLKKSNFRKCLGL